MTTKAKRMLHFNKCMEEVNSWTDSPMNSRDAAAYAMHNVKIAKLIEPTLNNKPDDMSNA